MENLATNLAMQKAFNLPFSECQIQYTFVNSKRDGKIRKLTGYINPCVLTAFRKRIGTEGVKFIEDCVYNSKEFTKRKKSKRVVVDTTAIPANVKYPTDINLLEQSRQFLLKLLSGKKVRTYKRVARKVFLSYIKLGIKFRKETKKVHKKMINFVKRNLKQVEELIDTESLSQKNKQISENIKVLLVQQSHLYKSLPRNGKKQGIIIKDRIVSIFKGHVRPIPRGKIPVKTEFGSKVLLEMINGFVFPLFITNENRSDNKMLFSFLANWKGKTLGGDRGFHSPENTKKAKEVGIKYYCAYEERKNWIKKNKVCKNNKGFAVSFRIQNWSF